MLDDNRFAQLIHDRWRNPEKLGRKDGDVAGAVETAVALLAAPKA